MKAGLVRGGGNGAGGLGAVRRGRNSAVTRGYQSDHAGALTAHLCLATRRFGRATPKTDDENQGRESDDDFHRYSNYSKKKSAPAVKNQGAESKNQIVTAVLQRRVKNHLRHTALKGGVERRTTEIVLDQIFRAVRQAQTNGLCHRVGQLGPKGQLVTPGPRLAAETANVLRGELERRGIAI